RFFVTFRLSAPSIFLPLSSCSFFMDTPPTVLYTLSLHDALPILVVATVLALVFVVATGYESIGAVSVGSSLMWLALVAMLLSGRSEEHTSELQSRFDLVCRLLLEKKKKKTEV